MDFGEGKEIVARKQHRCEWCLKPIERKEKHYHFKGKWDGDWQDWRMHLTCYADADSDPYTLVDGFTPGQGISYTA
jgi:hypothetical protein